MSNPQCEAIAKQTQFLQRQTKKLTAARTIKAYCLASCLELVSYRQCAILIGLLNEAATRRGNRIDGRLRICRVR
jgi:hypothetical protein